MLEDSNPAGAPLVSVVTPCLNPGKWLRRCLESVAAQTYPHVEHIVVDGGSTDGTVRELERAGVRFVSEPDGGQSEAINKGFRLAQGALLTWLNADDVLLPRAVEAVVETARADPATGWIYGDCLLRRSDGRSSLLRPPRRFDARSLAVANSIPQPGTFVARWALEAVGELDESFQLAMDYDLWLRLADAGVPAVRVSQTLAVFSLHEGSKTGSTNPGVVFREEARALLKSGREREAAFAFGRAAALLEVPVEELLAETRLDRGLAVAGCETELAGRELGRGSLRGLLRIARARLWRYPEARRRLAALVRFRIDQLRHRLTPRGRLP